MENKKTDIKNSNKFRESPLPNDDSSKDEVTKAVRASSPKESSFVGRAGAGGGLIRSVASVVSGSFLSKEATIKNFPFVFFLSFLAICYIANGYYADDQVRKVNSLSNEINELRTQYIVVKDSLVIKSKQTEVAKVLAAQQTGIVESVVPPKKIVIAPPGIPQGDEEQSVKGNWFK